jgi:uncharacterized delta-60 repeat protein
MKHTPFEALEGRRLMAAGDLDPTFGAGGKLVSQELGFPIRDLAVQRDGKTVVVGQLAGDFVVARLNTDGTVDRPFGGHNRGKVRTDFGGNADDYATAVAIQADGKIVVAGHRGNHNLSVFGDQGNFAVARYNPNGTLDKTFDDDGRSAFDIEGRGRSQANALAIQPDGAILVAGYADTQGLTDAGQKDDFAIARLLPNGRLDHTFGRKIAGGINSSNLSTGKLVVDFGSRDDRAYAVTAAPDGKILIGGIGRGRFAIARLTAQGTIDRSFGDGISGDGRFNALFTDGSSAVQDLVAQPDGSVIAVGAHKGDLAVLRLNSKGLFDRSFGDGKGYVVTDMGGGDDAANHVSITREGIVVAGASSRQFAMARYLKDGKLDPTFGQGGKVITSFGFNEEILTTTITSDGKILAYGKQRGKFVAARYFAESPSLAHTFARKGKATTSIHQNDALIARPLSMPAVRRIAEDLFSDRPLAGA